MPELAVNTNLRTESKIYTHHCICTNLLLATTYEFSKLPRRSTPGIDQAFILPCPPQIALPEQIPARRSSAHARSDYTLLVSLQSAPGHVKIVRRKDGFEKRYLLTCGRCKLVVGYQLDENQFTASQCSEFKGRREDVTYIIPGGIMSTEEMKRGRGSNEAEAGTVEDVKIHERIRPEDQKP